jgi:hypothetical protein
MATDAAGLHTACCLLRIRPVDMIEPLVAAVGSVPTKDYSADNDASFLLNEVIAPAFG